LQGAAQGLYTGWEYSGNGTLHVVAQADGQELETAFTLAENQLNVPAGGRLWIPPAFVGCYRGDIDAGSYSLHRFYLEKLRPPLPADLPDPMLTCNVFFKAETEAGLMTHLNLARDFGFEAFVVDAVWFPGSWQSHKGPWIWDTQRYPNGVKPFREFTREHKMLFGLWCAWGRNFDQAEALTKQIVTDNQLDYFKHDMGLIPDGSYARTIGYYKVMETLREAFPRLVLENCDAGGCIKDFGAMSRAHYIVTTDDLSSLSDRMSIYDTTFVFPPRVLQAYTWLQSDKPGPYLWRSAMMGAWVIDVPPLAGADTETVKKAVATYKSSIRPILQDCQVHHILPRPDGKRWDGMFYWGPQLKKGILFIFRPQSDAASQTVRLKGLDPEKRYQVRSEDGSVGAADLSGRDLMDTGLETKLPAINSSDLIFIEEIHTNNR
jgi:alpha-galactosidase